MSEEELAESLGGRAIRRALYFDQYPDDSWGDHGAVWLWLDDGRVVQFSSTGYDASSLILEEVQVVDIERCLVCGQEHRDRRVHTYADGRPMQAYCANDGNRAGWRSPERETALSGSEERCDR